MLCWRKAISQDEFRAKGFDYPPRCRRGGSHQTGARAERSHLSAGQHSLFPSSQTGVASLLAQAYFATSLVLILVTFSSPSPHFARAHTPPSSTSLPTEVRRSHMFASH